MAEQQGLSRSDILKPRPLPVAPVSVPEWGGRVHVRTLKGSERDAWEAGSVEYDAEGKPQANLANARARLVALCACDEQGQRLFSDDDVDELGELSAVALDRVYEAATKLNRLGGKALEEVRKNSGSAPSGASSSASLSPSA